MKSIQIWPHIISYRFSVENAVTQNYCKKKKKQESNIKNKEDTKTNVKVWSFVSIIVFEIFNVTLSLGLGEINKVIFII